MKFVLSGSNRKSGEAFKLSLSPAESNEGRVVWSD
jgi:hypothetical protein